MGMEVTGEARFTADIQLPGLLHARILRPPSHGAKLKTAGHVRVIRIVCVQDVGLGVNPRAQGYRWKVA